MYQHDITLEGLGLAKNSTLDVHNHLNEHL